MDVFTSTAASVLEWDKLLKLPQCLFRYFWINAVVFNIDIFPADLYFQIGFE